MKPKSALISFMDYLIEVGFDDAPGSNEKNDALRHQIYNLLARIKPLEGDMPIGKTVTKKNFYQESEWRFVPEAKLDTEGMLLQGEFHEKREIANKEVEHHKLLITPQDVRYIFIKEEKEIPDLVDFINTRLGDFSHNDLKMLVTRIVALDKLAVDI